MLMTVIKTITDLERIGDEAKKIARMGQRLVEAGYIHGVPRYMEIRHAARLVQDMLHVSLDTFARMDISAVAEVVKQDKQVDEEYRAIVRQLISFMMEDPRTISPALDMMFVAKAIERIGDHAKNMSEYVVYLVKGRDVRHVTIEEIEREVHPAQTNTSIGQPGA
jgi:phosphate transport system protein